MKVFRSIRSADEGADGPAGSPGLQTDPAEAQGLSVVGHDYPPNIVDEFSFAALLNKILRGWWIILIVVALAGYYAYWSLKGEAVVFQATMVVTPSENLSKMGLSTGVSAARELTSFLGVGSSSSGDTNFDQFLGLLTSLALMDRLQEKMGILQIVRGGLWNEERQEWVEPEVTGVFAKWNAALRHSIGMPGWSPPTTLDIASWVSGSLKTENMGASGFTRLAFQHTDPKFAAEMLTLLHNEADDLLRERAAARIASNLDYVERELKTVTVAEHRLVLVSMLASLERQRMLALSDLPFAAEVIDPATTMSIPVAPRPLFHLTIGIATGLVVGVFLALIVGGLRDYGRMKREQKQRQRAAG